MCGRFTQQLTWREIHDLYSLTRPGLPLYLQPRYNGAPAQDFAACRLDEDGNRGIAQLRWGLVPSWAKDSRMGSRFINARAETVHNKPSFGAAFRSRRCLVPANGWFEWQGTGHGKRPYFLRLADESPLSFAALWEHWGTTTEASSSPSPSSRRQPRRPWPTSTIGNRRSSTPTGSTTGSIRRRRCRGSSTWCVNLGTAPTSGAVSTRVNRVQNEDPDILIPMPERGYSDQRGGNVLNNASASNLLDRKKGNRRQPGSRFFDTIRIP